MNQLQPSQWPTIPVLQPNLATNQAAYARYKEARNDRQRIESMIRDEVYCREVDRTARAYQAGQADRYYGRAFNPRVLTSLRGNSRTAYSPIEISHYQDGWNAETDRKDWN